MIVDRKREIRKNKPRKSWLCILSLIISISLLVGCGTVQKKPVSTDSKYPEKPITVIVPFSAGSSLDILARAMEKKAPQYLGQPLIIVNKPGASGNMGWNELVASPPDGYTIGITSLDLLLNPLYGTTKYNYVTALDPLAQITAFNQVLAIRTEQPWQDLQDLITFSKQNQKKLTFAHSGIGSVPHVIGETFTKAAGISCEQVPFRGSSEGLGALLGGHVDFLITNPLVAKEYVKAGTIRALAVAGEKRIEDPVFAEVPTFQECGYNVVFDNWNGVAAPKELPPEIKTKLVDGFRKILNDPDFEKEIKNMGMQVIYLDDKTTQKIWLTDQEKYGKVVQETGILNQIKEQKK